MEGQSREGIAAGDSLSKRRKKKETTMLGYALLQNHFFNPSL
jgi:hypothetical protein